MAARNEQYEQWLGLALSAARTALASGDVPVGALVVAPDGGIIGVDWNARERDNDPTAHAEVLALREAARHTGSWRLSGATLVATLEPCAMCAGATMLARIDRVVFGAWDPKAGACGSVWDVPRDRRATHRCEVVGGIREAECAGLLRDFFEGHRDTPAGDFGPADPLG